VGATVPSAGYLKNMYCPAVDNLQNRISAVFEHINLISVGN
jgi:hypothetical protein